MDGIPSSFKISDVCDTLLFKARYYSRDVIRNSNICLLLSTEGYVPHSFKPATVGQEKQTNPQISNL